MNELRNYRFFEDNGKTIYYNTYIFNSDGTTVNDNPQRVEHKQLKACPFCGGKAEYKPLQAYGTLGARIHCTGCGASFVGLEGLDILTNKNTTLEQAITKLEKRWNDRVNQAVTASVMNLYK